MCVYVILCNDINVIIMWNDNNIINDINDIIINVLLMCVCVCVY